MKRFFIILILLFTAYIINNKQEYFTERNKDFESQNTSAESNDINITKKELVNIDKQNNYKGAFDLDNYQFKKNENGATYFDYYRNISIDFPKNWITTTQQSFNEYRGPWRFALTYEDGTYPELQHGPGRINLTYTQYRDIETAEASNMVEEYYTLIKVNGDIEIYKNKQSFTSWAIKDKQNWYEFFSAIAHTESEENYSFFEEQLTEIMTSVQKISDTKDTHSLDKR